MGSRFREAFEPKVPLTVMSMRITIPLLLVSLMLTWSCRSSRTDVTANTAPVVLRAFLSFGFVPLPSATARKLLANAVGTIEVDPYYLSNGTVLANGLTWWDADHRCYISFEPDHDRTQDFTILRWGCSWPDKETAVRVLRSWLIELDPQLATQFDTAKDLSETPSKETRRVIELKSRGNVVSIEGIVSRENRGWKTGAVITRGGALIYVH